MKTVLILIVIGVAGLGFYLGWFKLSSHNGNGKTNVTLSVDKRQIEADKDKAVDKMQDLGHQVADKTEATTQKAQD